MATYLLTNIGTRDVQLDSSDDLPSQLINPKSKQPLPRPAGEYLRQLEHFARFLPHIRLPLIEKALRSITATAGADLRIILYATNQDETVPSNFRDNDTFHFAHLIRDVLFERHKAIGVAKKHIDVRSTNKNPGDYDLMYDFYRQDLATVARRVQADESVYLLIAGGTPQMTTMLLLVGSEAFGPRAIPLYVSQELDRAYHLDITRQLYRQAFQRNMIVVLTAYAYPSALSLLQKNVDYLEQGQSQLLEAVLNYAIARSNLNLESAIAALAKTSASTRELRRTVQSLQQDVEDRSDVAQLRETIFLAQITSRTGNWADFLARLHRFSEGCMQLMAESLGVRWSNPKKRNSYAQEWWDTNRVLLASKELAGKEPPANVNDENMAREADRDNMRKIIEALVHAPEDRMHAALEELKIVDRPVPLRNAVVHRFTPLSLLEVEQKAEVSVDDLLAAMRRAYQYAFGQTVSPESPYDTINRLCAEILRGER